MVVDLLNGTPRCECGCGRPSQSAHHVVGRKDGDDVIENLMVLNGDGTRGCHGALTSGQRTYDARTDSYIDPAAVRSGLRHRMETERKDVLAYVLDRKGRAWLDRFYPSGR